MKRTLALASALLVGLTACGGGEPAADTGGAGSESPAGSISAGLTTPDWYEYDEGSNHVTLEIVAGRTGDPNYWNFNGYVNGTTTIVVPEGAMVTINFSARDPMMGHSIGVAAFASNPPATPSAQPVFEGAISSNATSPTGSTLEGQSESFTFTASQAGEYSLACFVPGHAIAGMWIRFNVSGSGEAGVLEG